MILKRFLQWWQSICLEMLSWERASSLEVKGVSTFGNPSQSKHEDANQIIYDRIGIKEGHAFHRSDRKIYLLRVGKHSRAKHLGCQSSVNHRP